MTTPTHPPSTRSYADGVVARWRGEVTDGEMCDLIASYGGSPQPGWWDQIRPHSHGWVTARTAEGDLAGFVNVVTDGGDHAFLIDTKTRGPLQRRGIATRVVALPLSTRGRRVASGCTWTSTTAWRPSTSTRAASSPRGPA